MNHTPHHPDDLFNDLADPALAAARQLAGTEHPVMDADRVRQLEAQILARAALQNHRHRRRAMRMMRWAVAACVVLVLAVTLVVGAALLDGGGPHIVTPASSAYDSPDSAIQPISQPVIIRESRESSLFVIPLSP